MTVRQMSEPQIARWARDVENQGVKVTRTKKGLMLRLPDGSTAMKHFTESDVRGPKNLAAVLRRAGVTSPDDKKPASLPKYITEGTITQRTRQTMVEFIERHDFPAVVFSKDVVAELGADPGSVNRMLYHCGFTVGESVGRKGRPWYTPDALLAMKEKDDNHEVIPEHAKQLIDGAREAQKEIDALTAPFDPPLTEQETEPVEEKSSFQPEPPADEDLQFIDTRDSWVVDMEALLGEHLTRMVKDRLSVLTAVGIDYEIRVWRER